MVAEKHENPTNQTAARRFERAVVRTVRYFVEYYAIDNPLVRIIYRARLRIEENMVRPSEIYDVDITGRRQGRQRGQYTDKYIKAF